MIPSYRSGLYYSSVSVSLSMVTFSRAFLQEPALLVESKRLRVSGSTPLIEVRRSNLAPRLLFLHLSQSSRGLVKKMSLLILLHLQSFDLFLCQRGRLPRMEFCHSWIQSMRSSKHSSLHSRQAMNQIHKMKSLAQRRLQVIYVRWRSVSTFSRMALARSQCHSRYSMMKRLYFWLKMVKFKRMLLRKL